MAKIKGSENRHKTHASCPIWWEIKPSKSAPETLENSLPFCKLSTVGQGVTQKPGYLQDSSDMNMSENTTKENQTASHIPHVWGIPALHEKLESKLLQEF